MEVVNDFCRERIVLSSKGWLSRVENDCLRGLRIWASGFRLSASLESFSGVPLQFIWLGVHYSVAEWMQQGKMQSVVPNHMRDF